MDRRGGREPPLWLEGCRWRHLRWAASSPPCLCGSVGPEGGWLAVLWVGRSWLVGPREPKKKKKAHQSNRWLQLCHLSVCPWLSYSAPSSPSPPTGVGWWRQRPAEMSTNTKQQRSRTVLSGMIMPGFIWIFCSCVCECNKISPTSYEKFFVLGAKIK